jgi:hypothetical protein
MATELENVDPSVFDPRNNAKSQNDLKFEAVSKAIKHLAAQQQKAAAVLDNVSEALSALLYTLEKGDLTFDNFQKCLPEVQASKFDQVLKNMLENKLAVQLSEVETNSAVMVSGWVGSEKKTLRRSFNVDTNENAVFLGKKVGDKVKLSEDDTEEFEVLVIYRIGQQVA